MQIFTDLNFQIKNTAVCIGKFDGLHKGHRLLLQEAKDTGLPVVMITFLFSEFQGIYSYEEKKTLAELLGVDYFVVIPVTEEFMKMEPETFIKNVLVEKCDAKKVVVGADFRFGYKRAGNTEILKEKGKHFGFEVTVYEKLTQDGEIISSTRIRKLLSSGKISEANTLLKTPYFMQGIVESGNQIGRKISVPTANIQPAKEKELPPFGVYAVRVQSGNKTYNGVGNLGVKPTIPGENPVGMEVWIFDYDGDLYDKEIIVSLIDFLREERKFANLEELQKQIAKDTTLAKEILSQQE